MKKQLDTGPLQNFCGQIQMVLLQNILITPKASLWEFEEEQRPYRWEGNSAAVPLPFVPNTDWTFPGPRYGLDLPRSQTRNRDVSCFRLGVPCEPVCSGSDPLQIQNATADATDSDLDTIKQ